jgi:hypothetical protein
MTILARNLSLAVVEENKPMTASFVSQDIDFKEMNVATIQAVVDGTDNMDGTFSLEVSLICDPNSFIVYPNSLKLEADGCMGFGWEMRTFAWRYVRVRYVAGTNTTGTVTIYARGRRT